ncbi:unnamed protein product [Leptidea sinapis]|uniref:C2H2-type domain-containing protein n=1 Tax=Leptidea sinapis TaxID=189913 RepID=A0A5E4QJY5_9NEOP|nr:unnamed protein product [Leptidea sinapis]
MNRGRNNNTLQQFTYKSDSLCYPTSSQGRMMILQRELAKKKSTRKTSYKPNKDKYNKVSNQNMAMLLNSRPCNCHNNFKNAQTSFCEDEIIKNNIIKKDCCTEIEQSTKDKLNTLSDNIKILKEKVLQSENDVNEISLQNIEAKLETLINSINILLDGIHSKKKKPMMCLCNSKRVSNLDFSTQCEAVSLEINNPGNRFRTQNVQKTLYSTDKYNFECENPDVSRLKEIFSRELKSEDLNDNKISEQNHFEIPTRECCSAITTSSKANLDLRNPINVKKNLHDNNNVTKERMTIAINTDPLSFLSLIRVSTETMKHFLSHIPSFDYCYYISMLTLPNHTKSIKYSYVCNICGANFDKPSELSDHIAQHDLVKSKDCCVCRHVLDVASKQSGLFRCRYCGQCFARAYCCELHQKSCAVRSGRRHDVNSELLILK